MAPYTQQCVQLVICIVTLTIDLGTSTEVTSELPYNTTNLIMTNNTDEVILTIVNDTDISCTFIDGNNTLDLSYFVQNNLTLQGEDNLNSNYYYKYTPCQNGITNYCTNSYPVPTPRMAYRYAHDQSDWCYDAAEWDGGLVKPTYSSYNQSWYFYYENGMTCNDEPGIAQIHWICDNTTDYKMNADEPDTCVIEFYIYSKYACPALPPINSSCEWTANNGLNMLNLTSLDNSIIINVDSSNTTLYFLYTPCKNGIECNEMKTMAALQDFEDDICSHYLAIWEGVNGKDLNIDYDPINGGSWQFVYTNGEKCNGFYENVFEVFWMCDHNEPQFRVIDSRQTGICSFQMTINSSLACN